MSILRSDALFEPLNLRSTKIANRITMSAMSRYHSPGGVPGENVSAYYRRRAEGNVGLILTEGTGIEHSLALDNDNIPVMYGENALAGWKRVVDAVHDAGGKIFPQLWHQGVLRGSFGADLSQSVGMRPSGIWGPVGKHSFKPEYVEKITVPTQPMTESEIADVILAFGRSAANAAKIGFDGIAIHGGHGYLIDSFLWEGTNRRTDKYGGSRRARTLFAVELVRAIREGAGDDLPIVFRFSHHKQQGYFARLADTPAELEEVLGPLADAGVDVFDASTRYFDEPAFEGSDLNLAGWAKKVTGKMSMAVGSVGLGNRLEDSFKSGVSEAQKNLPEAIRRFLNGEFDLLGVGRALIADPLFAQKVKSGESFLQFDKKSLLELV